MVHDAMKKNLESRKNIINVLEKENVGSKAVVSPVIPASLSEASAQVIEHNHAFGPGIQGQTIDSINNTLDSRFHGNDKKSESAKIESSMPLDRLLGDTPESPLPQTSIKQTPTQQATQ